MIRLENKDCFEYIKTIENASVDMVLSDPPYGISFSNLDWDKMSNSEYSSFMSKYLQECYRILKDGGTCIIFFGFSLYEELFDAINKSGLVPHYDFWKSICRQKGRGAKHKLKNQREDFILLSKGNDYYFKEPGKLFSNNANITNILNYYTGGIERPDFNYKDTFYNFIAPYYFSKYERQIHGCQKSLLLLYSLIKMFSPENGTIYDGFAGSGSCAIASKLAKRNFIGTELDTEMYNKSQEWINNFNYLEFTKIYLKSGFTFGGAF